MNTKDCIVCKAVQILAVVGCLNWGLIAIARENIIENVLGYGTLSRIIYLLIGIAGVLLLLKLFNKDFCPKCKKS